MNDLNYNKMILTLRLLCIGMLMFCVHTIAFSNGLAFNGGQWTIPDNIADFRYAVEVVYGAIVILLGYASELPPFQFLKRWKRVYKILALALVTAGVVIALGWSTAVELLISYTGATSFYELFLKPFFATKKVRQLSKKEKLSQLSKAS